MDDILAPPLPEVVYRVSAFWAVRCRASRRLVARVRRRGISGRRRPRHVERWTSQRCSRTRDLAPVVLSALAKDTCSRYPRPTHPQTN